MTNSHKSLLGIVFGLLCCLSATLTAQIAMTPLRVKPVIDGRLDEWNLKSPSVRIRTADRIWNMANRRPWGGPSDLSADIWFAHDATHFYLAGRIRDDHHVPISEGADLETGDSIEVFFDVESDGGDAKGNRRLGKEDVQLFLLPIDNRWFRRPWDRDDPGARPSPTDAEWTGIQLAHEGSGTSYVFEARIPFHNFLPMDGDRVIDRLGFHLAINDRDPGSDVVHYATLNGKNPTQDTQNFEQLEFAERLLASPRSGLGLDERIGQVWPWALVGLLVVLSILFFSRRRVSLAHLSPTQGLAVRVFGLLILLVGLLLPVWSAESTRAAEEGLNEAVGVLENQLPRMVKGTLTSYVGEARDQPMLDLLQGRPVRRKQSLSYQFLSELAVESPPKQFGRPPMEYPEEGFRVRPYWLPLPSEQPQSFAWDTPLAEGNLYYVVSPVDFGFFESPSPNLKVAYRLRDGSEVVRSLELGVARVACTVFGKPNRDMTYVADPIPAGVVGVSLTAQGGVAIELVGVTLVPVDPDAEPRPLVLGQALGEVGTDLRGVYPKDAGIELLERSQVRVDIPRGRARGFDRMWLVYSATYPVLAATEPPKGEEVCRVRIRFAKGSEELVLRHQESVFYEIRSRNSGDVIEGVPAVQAQVAAGEGENARINVVYRVDLRRNQPVHGLDFISAGHYPIRFRSVIFGYERSVAPPEPADSPLQADQEPGQVRLREDVRSALMGSGFAVYRNGSLAASDLDADGRDRLAEIPAPVQDELLRGKTSHGFIDVGDTRIFRSFIPLADEPGAALGVFEIDTSFGADQRAINLIGILLCLGAVPFLLLLFNDVLGRLRNLRLRLMAVVSVAAVAPMAVLFIILVRTLEGDHEAEQERAAREAVSAAALQLQDRQSKLAESVASQMAYLREVEKEVLAEAEADLDRLKARLGSAMLSRRDWQGGFMKLEYAPESGRPAWLVPFSTFDPESETRLDTPLREEPAVYVDGYPAKVGLIGVRIESGPMSLSVARPIDGALLGQVNPGQPTTLCALDGYALTVSEGHDSWLELGQQPSLLRARRGVRLAARDSREPVIKRHRVAGGSWIGAYEVLRDSQATPRALLGVVQRDQEAQLTLASQRIPVRTFFVVISGLLLVLSVALASIVTGRITDPIERLERGAEALRQGQFDIRVDSREGGQIGRLTEAFNNMAQDLRGRIQDLNHLNRGIQELTSGLDLKQVLASAIAFFSRHSPADRVRVILLDAERDRAELFGEEHCELDPAAPDVAAVLAAVGPLCMPLDAEAGGGLAALFPGYRSVLVLPLTIAGRSRGGILLLFESAHPVPVNLELLSTIAAQTTAALENARLYHHAVEDFHTGAYVPEYFARLVGHAVAGAQESGQSLSLLEVRLRRAEERREALGVDGFGRYLEKVASRVRRAVPGNARIGRSPTDGFQILLPECGPQAATEIVEALEAALDDPELHGRGGVEFDVFRVSFPEEGVSAEFLFMALEGKASADQPSPDAEALVEAEGAAGVIFSSPAMAEVVRVLRRVAPSELTILLNGETGTGKEVLANLIHKWSPRSRGPLVKVHCAALSEALLQSELFGHEKGAFTGAAERRLGKFEQAQGGTIFLDEIGEVSLDTQVKLLRVLQEREVDRVGGLAPVPVDVRVIAATNRDIDAMVAAGTFREDLYYRLQGMVVTVPPLRDRKSEIPALLEVFREEAVADRHTSVRGFSTDAMDEIFRRNWPGNVRELRNAAFRAMVLAGDGMVERSHLLGILTARDEDVAPVNRVGRPDPEGASPVGGEPEEAAPVPVASTAPRIPGGGREAGDGGAEGGDGGAEGGDGGGTGTGDGLPQVLLPRPAENPTKGLTPRLLTLYRMIEERGSLSNQDYVQATGISPRTGLRDLSELLARGLISRTGKRRGARYQLRKADSNSPSPSATPDS